MLFPYNGNLYVTLTKNQVTVMLRRSATCHILRYGYYTSGSSTHNSTMPERWVCVCVDCEQGTDMGIERSGLDGLDDGSRLHWLQYPFSKVHGND